MVYKATHIGLGERTGDVPLIESIDETSMAALGSSALSLLNTAELEALAKPQRTKSDFDQIRMLRDVVEDLPL